MSDRASGSRAAFLKQLGSACRYFLVTSSSRRQTDAAVVTLIVAIAVLWLYGPAYFGRERFPPDAHASNSLALAVGLHYCDRVAVSSRYNIPETLRAHPERLDESLERVVASTAGSIPAYCASLDTPLLNNENSLLILMRVLWRLDPGMSATGLVRGLGAMRLGLVLFVAYTLVLAGAGVPIVAAIALIESDPMVTLHPYAYSMYMFFVPLLLAAAAWYALMLLKVRSRPRGWLLGACFASGLLTGFGTNMRSSHLPIYLLMFGVFALLICAGPRMGRWLAASFVTFAAAYVLFNRLLIAPVLPTGDVPNYAHHVIAHPLVLGLALPANELTARENIRWDDAQGIVLARRMIPDAKYLGHGYEEGLFLYYARLWMLYPAEMREIYRVKLKMAGMGMFSSLNVETVNEPLSRALRRLPHPRTGQALMTLFGGVALAAMLLLWWQRSAYWLAIALIAAAGACVMVEATVIMPFFYMHYHSFLLVSLAIVYAAGAQLAVDAVGRLLLPARVVAPPPVGTALP